MQNESVVKEALAPILTPLNRLLSIVLRSDGDSTESGRLRYVAIVRGLVAAILSRGVGTLTALVAVPLTISYLGPERYGVWMTINAAIAWLMISDLGLGNGLVNAVAAAHGQSQPALARKHISNAFALLVSVSLLLMVLTLLLAGTLDLPDLLNIVSAQARDEVGPAITLTLLIFFASFPFTLVRKVLEAIQEGARAYTWGAAGSIIGLIGLLVVTQLQGGLAWLVVAVLGAQNVVIAASAVWLFRFHRPDLRPKFSDLEVASIVRLFRSGGLFFIVQILALLNLSSDIFIIAHILGPAEVTPFSVTGQLFSYTTLLQFMAFPLVWSGLAAAYSRGDRAWVVRSYKLFMGLSVASTVALVVPLTILAQTIIRLWAGATAVPPMSLVLWSAGWSILLAVMNSNACLLNSHSHLNGQIRYGFFTAIMNIGLSIWLAPIYGSTGVIAATVLAYLACALIPSQVEVLMIFRRTYGKHIV